MTLDEYVAELVAQRPPITDEQAREAARILASAR